MKNILTIIILIVLPFLVAAQESKILNFIAFDVTTGFFDTPNAIRWDEPLKSEIPVIIDLENNIIKISNDKEDTYTVVSVVKLSEYETSTIWRIEAYDPDYILIVMTWLISKNSKTGNFLALLYPEYVISYGLYLL